MNDLSSYTLEQLRSDSRLVLYRARSDSAEPAKILVAAPLSDSLERETLKRLEHEYALRTELDAAWAALPFALVRDNRRTMLVLEDPGGEPLDRLLDEPLELKNFLKIAVGLTAALSRLHQRSVVHKDIKPANVMVEVASGKVWLTGFGIASGPSRERQAPEPLETIAGTLPYMAPERTGRMNWPIDSRSDLYSLGVTLYQMLTGALPFTVSEPIDWVHCHIARQPTPVGEHRRNVPRTLSTILMKLLAKAPGERYQTAAGLQADLVRCLEDWESFGDIEPFVTGARDVPDRLTIPPKLYGRDREKALLLEAFDRVAESETPELVLVSGYSGVGKSSVVNELHQPIVLSGGIFVSGKFDQYKRDTPYATFAQALQSQFRDILKKSEAEVGIWRDALRDALGANGQLIVELIPELELLIGEQAPVTELSAQEAQNRFQSVFRALLGVMARKEHPFVIFLDDLQWSDAATLKLLELLVIRGDLHHLLLIGAYRDSEVSPKHPLTSALEAIRKSGAVMHHIMLAPLSCDDIDELVADCVHQEPKLAQPLGRLIYEKTAGNPFFAIQFLTALAEERLLEFDPREAVWRWDLDRIRAREITDNVAELLIGKLNRLPDHTREALKQLSCLGNSTGTAVLTKLHGGSEAQVHADFREAVREGFVVRADGSYKFAHDRIQEAAFSLISEQARAATHLEIGRMLVASTLAGEIDEKIFDVVNQLNRGASLVVDSDEKLRVAELNLRAAIKARASAAYAGARAYLATGMSMLEPRNWENRYEVAFNMWFRLAECEFLVGNFAGADALLSELESRAASKVDTAAIYCLRTDLHTMEAAYPEAVKCALECLRRFGIEMSPHPTQEQVQIEYEKVWRNLGERSIESLIDLPRMSDPEMRAIMRALSFLYTPAFFTDTNLLHLSICHTVNLSLVHGTSEASAHGYAYFGRILVSAFGRYDDGYRFGGLGVDLVEKYGPVAYKAKVYTTMAWVAQWTQPISVALDLIRSAFTIASKTGDFTYACYCCDNTLISLLARGDHLDEVWSESERSLDFVSKAGSRDYVDRIVSQRQFIQCMRGYTAGITTFSDAHFDQEFFEAGLAGGEAIAFWYWILKLQARFIAGDYETAIAAADKAAALLWAFPGCLQLLDYHFYTALTIAAVFDAASPDKQNAWRQALTGHLEQLRQWAENCSATFLDKHVLVSAEISRIERRDSDAMRLYEQAIHCAQENGFVHSEGICHEAAARFYFDRGFKTIGHAFVRNARACYARWGASAKVKQLDQLYPGVEVPMQLATNATTVSSIENLDLATVVGALQAVSREIDREKLIEAVMAGAVKHAGAERALLFLPHGQEHRIEAEATTLGDRIEVKMIQPSGKPPRFPQSILRYVARTMESVLLNDTAATNPFSDDPYVLLEHPRSVLCLPVIKRGELTGIIYLENSLAPHVFTQDRLEVLELLASQAAISLKNAQLYADLRQENAERRKAEEGLRQSAHALSQLQEEVRQASRVAMMGELTATLAHELNQPLSAILSNAQAARRFLATKKPDLRELGAAVEEIIGDNLRAAEIVRNVRALFQRDDTRMEPVDLKQILVDVERILGADAQRRNVTFRLHLPPHVSLVVGSRTQLLQALMNLVLNAFDAVCDDSVESRVVEIRATSEEPGQVHVAVSDSGKGIAPEIMPRLFDAFFTTKPDGMGMGLAIVRSIIENHGGRLWATRNPDRGATMEFVLPISGAPATTN